MRVDRQKQRNGSRREAVQWAQLMSDNVLGAHNMILGGRIVCSRQVLAIGQPPKVVLQCPLAKLELCGEESGHHLGGRVRDSPQSPKGANGKMLNDSIQGNQATEMAHYCAPYGSCVE